MGDEISHQTITVSCPNCESQSELTVTFKVRLLQVLCLICNTKITPDYKNELLETHPNLRIDN